MKNLIFDFIDKFVPLIIINLTLLVIIGLIYKYYMPGFTFPKARAVAKIGLDAQILLSIPAIMFFVHLWVFDPLETRKKK